MVLSHTYTVSILHVEWRMHGDVTHVCCKHFTRGMENGWNCHTRILYARVKCVQYTCVTIPSIFHSTCKMLTVYVCDISIHSPFHVLNAYSLRVLQFHPFSIPRSILHVEWRMDGDFTHVYCKHFTRGMENGWRCHTRML
jgi:hypothetical protein